MLATASIRTKITVVVAFLLVAMTGLGIVAVRSMKAVNTSAAEIQSGWLPNIRLLGELQKNVIQNRSVARAYLLADTAEGKEAVAKRYDGFLGSKPIFARSTGSSSSPRKNAHFMMNGADSGTVSKKALTRCGPYPARPLAECHTKRSR